VRTFGTAFVDVVAEVASYADADDWRPILFVVAPSTPDSLFDVHLLQESPGLQAGQLDEVWVSVAGHDADEPGRCLFQERMSTLVSRFHSRSQSSEMKSYYLSQSLW